MNTFWEKIIHYVRISTIHGLPKIVARKIHILERFFWAVMFAAAMVGAIALSLQNLGRFSANPTVVSLQKDYRNWFNPFPSATVCFIKKTDEYAVEDYILEHFGVTENDTEKYDYYVEFIDTVAHLTYETVHKLEKYENDEDLKYLDFVELSYELHPEPSGALITFDTSRKTSWDMVLTEMGICYAMNTKLSQHFAYKDAINASKGMSDEDILKCHYLNGLCYARYDSDPDAPLKVYIHSYYEIAHATSEITLHVQESEEVEQNFQLYEITSDERLRSLSPAQRNCRFDDEPMNKDIPAYSTAGCYMSCRYRFVKEKCGCKPHFYYNFPGKLCDLKGLLCVVKYVEQLTQAPEKLGCKCPQPCDLIMYLPQAPKITVWEYGYFEQRITFRWALLPPTTKYHRDVLFGFEDLVVSIGGTLALFLGVSFITAIEIIFNICDLIIYVVYWHKRNARKQTHKIKLVKDKNWKKGKNLERTITMMKR